MDNAKLTDKEWEAADAAVQARVKATKPGTPEGDAARKLNKEWMAATALPAKTIDAEQLRLALENGLVTR